MNNELAFVMNHCRRLEVGQRVEISRYIFEEAFPCHPLLGMYRNPTDAFLSNMIGSAWGIWRVTINCENGNYIISKHKGSKRRYYVDPDRRHLFKQQPDGTYEQR